MYACKAIGATGWIDRTYSREMMKFMQRSRISSHAAWIAGCAALIYAVLAVMSVGCALAHADRAQNHHHQSDESSSAQNALCAWACQATSDVAMAPESPKAMAWLVVEPTVLTPDPRLTSSGLSIRRSPCSSRAHPCLVWIGIGASGPACKTRLPMRIPV